MPIMHLDPVLPKVHCYKVKEGRRGHNSSWKYTRLSYNEAGEEDSTCFETLKCSWLSCGRMKRRTSKTCLCKVFLCLNVVGVACFMIYYQFATIDYYRIKDEDFRILTKQLHMKKCNFPSLNPFSEEILPHLKKVSSLNCVHSGNPSGEVAFIQVVGKRILRQVADVDGNCCYRPFHRVTDDEVTTAHHCVPITSKMTVIPEEYEFIEVICVGGGQDYRDGFAFVNEKPELENWIGAMGESIAANSGKITNNGTRSSVIILGMDATSHMNFLRMMPKSSKFLINSLGAIVMHGYTKVAENTLPNVIPLLTGKTLEEFKYTCIDSTAPSHAVNLDTCPFLWKQFAMYGYRTAFAEDDVDIGIFNMNWRNAFDTQPTDYYLRPFSKMMETQQSSGLGYCYGTRLSYKVLLDNLQNLAVVLKDKLYFAFTWATKLSHNSFNMLHLGDAPLLKFLRFMNRSELLNNTWMIIMSDHGSRLDNIRSTPQGKLEDRMPLLYIVPPTGFSSRYPQAYRNLKTNSQRLTSAFDMYETLKDLMDLSQLDYVTNENDDLPIEAMRNPVSLFNEVPVNRSCFQAGIPLHWCVCRGSSNKSISKNSPEVKEAVQHSIDSMNYHLRSQRSCANLELAKTVDAFYIDFDSNQMESKEKLEVETTTKLPERSVLRISFVTTPGGGSFEASLINHLGRWILTESVVRTNEYGTQSQCVEYPYKEFCFCK